MTRSGLRLTVVAALSVGLIVASTLVLDWFRANLGLLAMGVDAVKIDLRSIHACSVEGVCASVPMTKLQGMYPAMASAAFWSSLVLAAVVAFQAGSRLMGGTPSAGVNRTGYLMAMLAFCTAGAAGYLFGPDTGSNAELSLSVTRSWGPSALLLGDLLAMFALYYAVSDGLDDAPAPIVLPRAVAQAPVAQAGNPAPVPAKPRLPDSIPLDSSPVVAEPRAKSPTRPPDDGVRIKSPTAPPIAIELPPRARPPSQAPFAIEMPTALRGKLRYAAASAALMPTGIEARLDDGAQRTVQWADVVGIVARRLPPAPPFDGATFVDLVSTAGATLRILPWTRIVGVSVDTDDRARTFVQLVAARCPGAQLDGATRTFLGSHGPAAQLPDAATLAQHDDRLA